VLAQAKLAELLNPVPKLVCSQLMMAIAVVGCLQTEGLRRVRRVKASCVHSLHVCIHF